MSGLEEVTAAAAIEEVAAGTWLLDVREQDEWDRGHASAAHLVPMSQLNESISEIPDDERVLVVCHAGGRSLRVTRALMDAGYQPVNVEGGMLAWVQAGGEIVADAGRTPTVE